MRQRPMRHTNAGKLDPITAAVQALQVEAAHFTDCVARGARPQSDGESGLRVVRLLEAASASMQQHGRPVDIQGVAAG